MANAARELELRQHLRIDQAAWLSLWRDCAAFCCPDRRQIVNHAMANQPDAKFVNSTQAENSVAKDCVNVVSGGMRQWVIPDGWFQWQPAPQLQGNMQVKEWLADCTARAQGPLEASGFYDATHEMFKDLVVFGTGGKTIMEGVNTPLHVQALAPTEFVFQTNWDGEVSRYIVTYHKTADELFKMFGDEVPEKVKADLAGNRPNNKHEVINSVYTRDKAEMKVASYPDDPKGKPIESCWIHVNDKKVMSEAAFDEMPLTVPRWDKWSNSSAYGVSPAMNALADIRGLNVIDMILAVHAELQINPRVMRGPAEMGAIDLSPGGVTSVTQMDAVKEWATSGSFAVGEKQIERKEASIRAIFHADLFRQISNIQREMTKFEAQMREAEGVIKIAAPMSRLGRDDINPGMRRTFMILYRKGIFAPPPDEAFYTDASGARYLLFPKTIQTNRMARAINGKKNISFNNLMNRVLPIAEAGRPEVLDNYKWDDICRDMDVADGVPGEWHQTPEDVEKLRAARAQAQKEAAAQEAALKAIASKPAEVAALAQQVGAGQ